MKILIADDDNASRLLLSAHLKSLRHEVLTAADGAEAWERYLAELPQIVITDWLMPGIDGLEICRMIRSERRKKYTYVMLLTSLSGKGSFLEGMRAGADDFITKPFDTDALAARITVAERIIGMEQEIAQLQSLLPICSYCKRLRDEDGVWRPMEEYISRRLDASLSHGVCPDCYADKVDPQIQKLRKKKQREG